MCTWPLASGRQGADLAHNPQPLTVCNWWSPYHNNGQNILLLMCTILPGQVWTYLTDVQRDFHWFLLLRFQWFTMEALSYSKSCYSVSIFLSGYELHGKNVLKDVYKRQGEYDAETRSTKKTSKFRAICIKLYDELLGPNRRNTKITLTPITVMLHWMQ